MEGNRRRERSIPTVQRKVEGGEREREREEKIKIQLSPFSSFLIQSGNGTAGVAVIIIVSINHPSLWTSTSKSNSYYLFLNSLMSTDTHRLIVSRTKTHRLPFSLTDRLPLSAGGQTTRATTKRGITGSTARQETTTQFGAFSFPSTF